MGKRSDKEIAHRVVERFATVQLDDRMKTLLLKLRKGADASLTLKKLFEVLSLLGGWRVEKFIGLVKLHGYGGDKDDQPHLLGENDEATARKMYDQLKAKEVSSLPSHPEVGREYVMDLEPFKSWEAWKRAVHGAQYRSWLGAPGYRITDPNGKVFELLPGKYDIYNRGQVKFTTPKEAEKYLKIYEVLPWLKKETTYLQQISDLLGMEPHEKSAPRTRDNTGTCGACFRNIKLNAKSGGQHPTMALHGYERPGIGYIQGRCPGGAHPPYELSPEGTKMMLNATERNLKDQVDYLARLKGGKVTEFSEQRTWGPARVIKKGDPDFNRMLESRIAQTESFVRHLEHDAKVYTWLIANWEERPLPREGETLVDWYNIASRKVGR